MNNFWKIIFKIIKIHLKHPELRFCQLIMNCFINGADIYYIKDEELLRRIKWRYFGSKYDRR